MISVDFVLDAENRLEYLNKMARGELDGSSSSSDNSSEVSEEDEDNADLDENQE